ncbi:MAG: low molecular weight phosphatase family protein [Candidatus Hodarchaeota archaeon]
MRSGKSSKSSNNSPRRLNLAEYSPITILFLCSGNIIRSAYAELVFDKMISEDACLKERIRVRSGALKYFNRQIFSEIIPFIIQEGVDQSRITNFRPRHIMDYPELLTEANLILVMTQNQLNLLPSEYRNMAYLLYQYVFNESLDIPDPFFDPPMKHAVNLLKKALVGLLEKFRTEFCPPIENTKNDD